MLWWDVVVEAALGNVERGERVIVKHPRILDDWQRLVVEDRCGYSQYFSRIAPSMPHTDGNHMMM